MVIAQCVISLPIITGFTMASIQNFDPKLRLQITALGASRWQMLMLLLRETKLPLLAAVMAGFGSVISEVGASMMVGGNIQGQTRVLTTAIVLENSKGEFGIAIALGIILMVLVYAVNLVLTIIQQRSKAR
jgi:tungstate transport system permease protein